MQPTQGREIRDVALLDLTGANSAAALDGGTRISQVATIRVPESVLPRLSSIHMPERQRAWLISVGRNHSAARPV